MPSLYLGRLSKGMQDRELLIKRLHESQKGNCFICGCDVDLVLHANSLDVDHIEPLTAGGKDGPENFALTHDSCNRSKQASDLRVARVLASFNKLAQRLAVNNRSPNLGDVLREHGGSKYKLPVVVGETSMQLSFTDMGLNEIVTLPLYMDKLSGFRSSFMDLPIEYLHHDDYINPRTIGSNLRKLVEEFHKRLPQLHISLGWIDTTNGNQVEVKIFDGQHKAAAQVLLGARFLPVRVFIDPNTDLLLTANTNAGTSLRQVAFDKSVQRSLGSSILSNRIDRYRADRDFESEDESFSEQDLVNHFRGEARQMRRYVLDRVRDGITRHPDNKLRDYIEYGGRSTSKPLSYIAVENSFYQHFIHDQLLTTPFNHRFQEGTNPRQLEIEQMVKLMNIVAEKIYIDKFDPKKGTQYIESDVRKGKEIAEPHLRAFRMSKQEILHSWIRLVRQVVYQYFVNMGKPIDESKLFQQEIPEPCWKNVENFIDSLTRLPLWANKDLAFTDFDAKRTNEYWLTIFQTGSREDGGVVIPSGGLNLTEMIKREE